MDKTEHYSSQNLYECAFLLCRGFKLAGKTQGGKVTVGFVGKNVREEAMKFYNGGLVKAKAYSDAYRTLKDYIFEK